MSKRAEQRGLERVPPRYRKSKDGERLIDSALPVRKFYIEAYTQAERDLALTWEDMEAVHDICKLLVAEHFQWYSDQEFYEEVLRRFNKQREE